MKNGASAGSARTGFELHQRRLHGTHGRSPVDQSVAAAAITDRTALPQPARRRSRVAASCAGVKVFTAPRIALVAARSADSPHPTPASIDATRAVVSAMAGLLSGR